MRYAVPILAVLLAFAGFTSYQRGQEIERVKSACDVAAQAAVIERMQAAMASIQRERDAAKLAVAATETKTKQARVETREVIKYVQSRPHEATCLDRAVDYFVPGYIERLRNAAGADN
jgi:hypothetical protein